MNSHPSFKITIITATYNREKTIEHTIQSILKQTYTNIEYIIIDGASTDQTIEIIHRYEPLFDGRIKWISESDEGVYDALNKGIQMATGDIIGILHSDDFFTNEQVLHRIVTVFKENPTIDAIYGDVHYVKSENLQRCIRYYSSRIFHPSLMRLGFMPAHPSFYMKKKIYNRIGIYKTDYKIAGDFELLLRIIYKGRIKTKYIPMDMVTMRDRGLSTSGIKSHLQIMKDHLRAFHENGLYTNAFILSLRYIYKLGEILRHKIQN